MPAHVRRTSQRQKHGSARVGRPPEGSAQGRYLGGVAARSARPEPAGPDSGLISHRPGHIELRSGSTLGDGQLGQPVTRGGSSLGRLRQSGGRHRRHRRPPALKCLAQRAIERPGAHLEQQVCCFRLPSHLTDPSCTPIAAPTIDGQAGCRELMVHACFARCPAKPAHQTMLHVRASSAV